MRDGGQGDIELDEIILEDDTEQTDDFEIELDEIELDDIELEETIVAPIVDENGNVVWQPDIELELDEEDIIELDVETTEEYVRAGIDRDPKDDLESFYQLSYGFLEFVERSFKTSASKDEVIDQEMVEFLVRMGRPSFIQTKHTMQLLNYLLSGISVDDAKMTMFKLTKPTGTQVYELGAYVDKVNSIIVPRMVQKTTKEKLANAQIDYILNRYLKSVKDFVEFAKEYLDADKEVVFVRNIILGKDLQTFICGKCGEESDTKHGFFKPIISERPYNHMESFILFPLGDTCDKCGTCNILTFADYSKIQKKYDDISREDLMDWLSTSSKKLSSSDNLMSYTFSNEFLRDIDPNLYFIKDTNVETKEEVKNGLEDLMLRWNREFQQKLKLFTDFTDVSARAFVMEEGTPRESKGVFNHSVNEIARIYCSMFAQDYVKIREDGLNALLGYMKENPMLMTALGVDSIFMFKTLSLYKGYVDGKLTDEEVKTVYPMICADLGVECEGLIVEGVVQQDKKVDIDSQLREKLEENESMLNHRVKTREVLEKELYLLAQLFRFIEIRQSSKKDLSEFSTLLADPQMRDWVSLVVDLMIINKLSKDILEYWVINVDKDIKPKQILLTTGSVVYSKKISDMVKRWESTRVMRGLSRSLQVILPRFLGRSTISRSAVGIAQRMKRAVDTNDYYSFCFSVVDMKGLIDHTSMVLKPYRDMIDELYAECKAFCDEVKSKSTGNETLDYYLYHYEKLFSREEIEESNLDLYGMGKRPFFISKQEEESFNSYLRRLHSPEIDNEEMVLDENASKFVAIRRYVPYIYGVAEYLNFLHSDKEMLPQVFINDLVYYANYLDKEFTLELLCINPKIGVSILSQEVPELFKRKTDLKEYEISFILNNLVYPTDEFNLLVGDSDQDDDEASAGIADKLAESLDEVLENLKYFVDFRGEVSEYYSGGNRQSD